MSKVEFKKWRNPSNLKIIQVKPLSIETNSRWANYNPSSSNQYGIAIIAYNYQLFAYYIAHKK